MTPQPLINKPMTFDELKAFLMRQAKDDGICADGYKKMSESDKSQLVEYYLKTIDWSLIRGLPNLETLAEYFSDCEDYGVFVNRNFNGETLSGKQAYVFHNCNGIIDIAMDYEKAVIPMLYFANESFVTLKCSQVNKPRKIKVPVYIFGKNDVGAINTGGAYFIMHYHELRHD